MAVNTITVSGKRYAGGSVRTIGIAAGRAANSVSAWLSRLAASGQLGPDREREVGRHTGSRI